MCDFCKEKTGVDYIIKGSKETLRICPNCIVKEIYNDTLHLPKGNFESEISKAKTAVKITEELPSNIEYTLTESEAIRLLGYMLLPEEYKILTKTHLPSEFLLHEDFYDEDGYALQPIDDERYEYMLINTKDKILDERIRENASFKETNNIINLIDER